MKITTQRLNEIIEEEVISFKQLNESELTPQSLKMISDQINRIRTIATTSNEEAIRVNRLLNGIK